VTETRRARAGDLRRGSGGGPCGGGLGRRGFALLHAPRRRRRHGRPAPRPRAACPGESYLRSRFVRSVVCGFPEGGEGVRAPRPRRGARRPRRGAGAGTSSRDRARVCGARRRRGGATSRLCGERGWARQRLAGGRGGRVGRRSSLQTRGWGPGVRAAGGHGRRRSCGCALASSLSIEGLLCSSDQ